jgi:hypothetical protein
MGNQNDTVELEYAGFEWNKMRGISKRKKEFLREFAFELRKTKKHEKWVKTGKY